MLHASSSYQKTIKQPLKGKSWCFSGDKTKGGFQKFNEYLENRINLKLKDWLCFFYTLITHALIIFPLSSPKTLAFLTKLIPGLVGRSHNSSFSLSVFTELIKACRSVYTHTALKATLCSSVDTQFNTLMTTTNVLKLWSVYPWLFFSESSDKPISITAVIKELRTSLMIA